MANLALIAAIEQVLALAKADTTGSAAVAPDSYEGRLSPDLLSITYYTPGTDYAGRPTDAGARAPAIPSQLDEIGQYTARNWISQTPPVSFMDYLLMLHDLVPELTPRQRARIENGRHSSLNLAIAHNGASLDMPYIDVADRWLWPEKYETQADRDAAAKSAAQWEAHWAAKEKQKQKPPTLPPVGTE